MHQKYSLRVSVHPYQIILATRSREMLFIDRICMVQKHVEGSTGVNEKTELPVIGGNQWHVVGPDAVVELDFHRIKFRESQRPLR